MKRIASVALILGLAGPATAQPEPAPTAPGRPANFRVPFGPGEKLEFAVKFGPVRAGNASLEVTGMTQSAGEPVIQLVSVARSSRFFNSFYPVDNRYTSTWSLDRLVPLSFSRKVREGSFRKDETVRFDHRENVALYQDGQRFDILPASQDVLSAFYHVRGFPMVVGNTVTIPNHANGKSYVLHVRVLRKEEVEVPAGKFRCVVIEPKLESEGVFQQKGTLTIWLTDDARRMPVLMKSKIKVGSVTAELERYKIGIPVRELMLKGEGP